MEFDSWYKQLPFVTKHMLIGALATAALISFNIISYKYLVLDITKAFKQLQLWRLVSHFFIFGRFSVNFFFKMLMLYFGISHLEEQHSPKKYSDLFYLLIICCSLLNVLAVFLERYFMAEALSFCMLYIWCKRSPFDKVQFLFGFIVSSGYLPWVIIVYSLLTGDSIEQQLMGLVVGHIYIVLKDILPNSATPYNLLVTPSWLNYLTNKYYYNAYNLPNNRFNNLNQQQQQQQQPNQFRAFAGRGVQLG